MNKIISESEFYKKAQEKKKLEEVSKTFEQNDYDIPQAIEYYLGAGQA